MTIAEWLSNMTIEEVPYVAPLGIGTITETRLHPVPYFDTRQITARSYYPIWPAQDPGG